jgi:hypothetical protein
MRGAAGRLRDRRALSAWAHAAVLSAAKDLHVLFNRREVQILRSAQDDSVLAQDAAPGAVLRDLRDLRVSHAEDEAVLRV